MAGKIISAKELRASLPKIVDRIRKGDEYTVLYRSRPAFRLVPVNPESCADAPLEEEPLYRAPALGRSSDGRTSAEHDEFLYGKT